MSEVNVIEGNKQWLEPLAINWYEPDEFPKGYEIFLREPIQIAMPDYPILAPLPFYDLGGCYIYKKVNWKIYKAVFGKDKQG